MGPDWYDDFNDYDYGGYLIAHGVPTDSSAKSWRDKFLRGPYLREYAIARGVMRETMETCITWERFAQLREIVTGMVA